MGLIMKVTLALGTAPPPASLTKAAYVLMYFNWLVRSRLLSVPILTKRPVPPTVRFIVVAGCDAGVIGTPAIDTTLAWIVTPS